MDVIINNNWIVLTVKSTEIEFENSLRVFKLPNDGNANKILKNTTNLEFERVVQKQEDVIVKFEFKTVINQVMENNKITDRPDVSVIVETSKFHPNELFIRIKLMLSLYEPYTGIDCECKNHKLKNHKLKTIQKDKTRVNQRLFKRKAKESFLSAAME